MSTYTVGGRIAQESMSEHLGHVLGGPKEERVLLEKELITAVNRVNYNQPNSLNALAGTTHTPPLRVPDR